MGFDVLHLRVRPYRFGISLDRRATTYEPRTPKVLQTYTEFE